MKMTSRYVFLVSILMASLFSFSEGLSGGIFEKAYGASSQDAGNEILDPTALDLTVSPCQDFYRFACGGWLDRTTIPSDQSDWGRGFSVVYEQNLKILNEVLQEYSQGNYSVQTPYAQKLGSFYSSCMNQGAVEAETPSTVANAMAEIDSILDRKDLPAALARLHLENISAFFLLSSAADLKDPTLVIAQVDQGGLGLPDATYYTKMDDQSVKLRKAYQAHIVAMFKLAGASDVDAQRMAAQVFGIELVMAQNALPPEELQDPIQIYHPIRFAALQSESPEFSWTSYLQVLGVSETGLFNLTEPRFLRAVGQLLATSELDAIRSYLKWHRLEAVAPFLGQEFYKEWFAFEGMALKGQKQAPPRWKQCVRTISGEMSEALGQAFVAKTFPPEAKARVEALIGKLREAYTQNLQKLDWLDEQTRAAALEKLSLITQKIGYPEQWRNYDRLVIGGSYFQNVTNSNVFEKRRVLSQIGGKVDPAEWYMSPQTVNAYYDPSVNQINFPAGILQPPFFSASANDALNFGAIGMVIGHEITHGFDTSGSQFDGHGAQKDWWSPEVKKLFDEKAECLIHQYDTYEALPDLHVNGKLTITENIADQGGLKLAYAAFKLAREGQPALAPIAGLNEDQQFFVAMGQSWCEKQTDASLRRQVSGDPHSPPKFRVMGTMVNSPDFSRAFGCSLGEPMAPKNRCSIW
jgi:putative endopeptidase